VIRYSSIDDVPRLPGADESGISYRAAHYDVLIDCLGPDRWWVRTEPDSGLEGVLVHAGGTYGLVIERNEWLSRSGFGTWPGAVRILF
jgi:hypothetical protein